MLENLQSVIEKLKSNSSVVGIIQYGRRTMDDMSLGGDFDLFVFMQQRPETVESLHFFVQDIPVDMNIRVLDDLSGDMPITPFDVGIMDGRVIYDPTGRLAELHKDIQHKWQPDTTTISDHSRAFTRFSHRHALDKVRHRLDTHPLFCEVLLSSNVYWLLQAYFRLRQLPFKGERDAIAWLQTHDEKVHSLLDRFFASHDLAAKLTISEELSAIVLDPIGGLWQDGEILAFGHNDDVTGLQAAGKALYQSLLDLTAD